MIADQEQEQDHDHGELKVRQVGYVEAEFETSITIEHVYRNDVCSDCGTLNTGLVGIRIHTGEEDENGHEHDERRAGALLHADEALLLADRITRAAHLVLETTEELADIEREVIRHTEGHEEGIRHD